MLNFEASIQRYTMNKEHHYKLTAVWHGNKGTGTSKVSAYERSHTITIGNKPELHLTTDNAFYGDKSKLNPEDLLVSALASCHLMSYLYLCAMEGVVVTAYEDHTTGTMIELEEGGGSFREVTLNPVVTVANESMVEKAIELHHEANKICYIANSMNFEVKHNPICKVENA
jgi:organic hydroperoxide reductase OsmC/OhrA